MPLYALAHSVRHRAVFYRERYGRHGFVRSVGVMLAGTMAGQAISLMMSPALTRLFTPAEFGAMGAFGSIVMICATVGTFGFELAIPVCRAEREYRNLAALCWLCLALVCILVALVAFLVPASAFSVAGLNALAQFRYLFPLGLIWLSGYYILLAIATRARTFRDVASTRLAQGIGGPTSQVLLGLLGTGAPGLITGFIVGQACATLMLVRRFAGGLRAGWDDVSLGGMVAVARRYIRFPLYSSWSRLIDVAGSGDILLVLFAACYSPDIAGFMFLSERVVVRPLMMVSTSLLQVFIGEAGRAISEDPDKLRRRIRQLVPAQFLVAAVWILAANLAAVWAFPTLFGAEWERAIPYLRALSLAYLIQVTLHPVYNTLLLLERQGTEAVWQVCRLALVSAAVLLPWRAGVSAVTALWVSSLVQAACCVVMLGLILAAIEKLRRAKPRSNGSAVAGGIAP